MRSYPFTSQVTYDEQGLPLYDRAVDSEFLRKVFARYFSDGVFYKPTSALQVVADSGMQVKVNPGCCHIQGAIGIEDAQRTLVVQAAEALDRIDTVVARLDLSVAVRSIDLYVVKGTAGESPQAPALTRDSTIWELGLANIFVAKNTATISQQRITDTRLDTSRCGVVAQTIGDLDTEPYYTQLAAMIEDLREVISGIEASSEVMLKAVYDTKGRGVDVYDYGPHLYRATLELDAWSGEGPYTQTATLKPMDGGPAVTAQSQIMSGVMCEQTASQETNEALQEVLGIINAGQVTLGDGSVAVTVFDKPESDIEAIWQIRQGGEN